MKLSEMIEQDMKPEDYAKFIGRYIYDHVTNCQFIEKGTLLVNTKDGDECKLFQITVIPYDPDKYPDNYKKED